MRSRRTVAEKCWQVLQGSVITGTKEDESSTGRFWAVVFYHVTTISLLQPVLKLMNRLFL
jgi:hypothetical protein